MSAEWFGKREAMEHFFREAGNVCTIGGSGVSFFTTRQGNFDRPEGAKKVVHVAALVS